MAESEIVEEELPDESVEEESNDSSLELSDEDFLNTPLPSDEPEEEVVEEEEEEAPTEDLEEEAPEETPEEGPETIEEPEPEEDVPSEEETSEDFGAKYKQALAPLKANGKVIEIDNIEDLRNLASMGLNYQAKMVGIKPYRKTAKKLENNNIDDATLDYLIDLHKGNPEAIQKMMKDHKIDPLDVDTEKDSKYSPNDYTVNDKEVELDEVLVSLQDTPSFSSTVDIISNKWDESSKKVVLDHPEIIKVINEHVSSGVYEQIASVVFKERALGRLTGLSDLEAYKQVGDAIQAQGGFAQAQPQAVVKPKATQKATQDPKLKNRKKAASSTKGRASKNPSLSKHNPLDMSDEEFESMASSKYL